MCVEGLGFSLQGLEKAQGRTTGLNLLSGEAEREDNERQGLIRTRDLMGYILSQNICLSVNLSLCLSLSVSLLVSLAVSVGQSLSSSLLASLSLTVSVSLSVSLAVSVCLSVSSSDSDCLSLSL